ncbi:MAG: replicative DNA helicase [Crocinitomicaceae bacterium]|jgi:replicative DNA helicase|nr:replicative DNA helicase [Crocinitomicaceae bacterium]MCF8410534.1 replicative DNA helicase [Crocinitomicaceae bacterium]MCF8444357.1 replicative DNA helicase [Crocinitomicaceae bacterium]
MDMNTENGKKTGGRIKQAASALLNDIGKLPPQAVDIEQIVLGAMMLEKNAVSKTIDILKPASFYDPKHQYIYAAIRELFASTNPIDLITVTTLLKKRGELEASGGAAYLSQLTNRVASAAHIEFHARVISEKHIKRELIRMSSDIIRDSYDDTKDVFDVMGSAEGELFQIAENNMGKQVQNLQSVVLEAIEEIEKASQNTDGISGVPTGFFDLDKLTSGWQRSDMIVIAARPAMGKTAFVLSMARNTAVDYGKAVALFSLEMSSVQLVKRLISSEARIHAEKLRKGNLREDEFQQLHTRITKLATAPIFIDDTAGLSVFDLRAKCRRLKMQHNIELVIIDYLQLMSAKDGKGGGNREQEISTISRSIKEIAKELNIPIIALSQLSRSVEQRGGDKRPILSDLRESGAIEQDADIVGFIYRPDYYGFLEDEDGNPNNGIGEIIIAKHRNGATDRVRLRFVQEYARFENIESFEGNSMNDTFKNAKNESYTITVPSNFDKVQDSSPEIDLERGEEAPF